MNSAGIITTVAGDGVYGNRPVDGTPAVNAHLDYPCDVAVDSSGNLFIGDTFGYAIYRVSNVSGLISTAAGVGSYGSAGDGGAATGAYLSYPRSLAVDVSGNLYIADASRVREVYAVFTSQAPTLKPTVWNPNVVRMLLLLASHCISMEVSTNVAIA